MISRVLIVDDTRNDRYLLEKVLKEYGYQVISAENGAEALELARKEPPDMIVSDIMMPIMDGFALCRAWKKDELLKTIPFIFYTATYTTPADEDFALSLGAKEFIIKPQEPKALIQKLRQILEEYGEKNSVVSRFPLGEEMEFFRNYSKVLFRKLEKKVTDLQNQKEFLNNIFESLTSPFYVIDANNYSVLMANSAASMNQLTRGSKCFALAHKLKIPCSGEHICPLEEVKKTRKPVTVEHIHYDKEGNTCNVAVHGYPIFNKEGKVVQMIEYCLDITEHKRAEKEIRLLASIVKNIPDSVCTIGLDGNIITWNEGAERMLGYNKVEILGKPITITIPEDLAEKELAYYVNVLNEEGFFTGYESVRITRDGRIIPVEITGVALKDDKQNITGYTSIIRDITDHKKAEETRLENLRLETADKAKSEFLASMSHELRTPLNASIGFSEILKQGMAGELNEKQRHYVENIITSNQFLLALINDILDLSKIEAGKIELVPEKMSVPLSIQETLSLIKEKAMNHNVLLKTEIDPQLEFIEADKQRFKQILFNLLSNAVKFSKDEGGAVTITTKKEGDTAKVSVSDTGIGIRKENLCRLFQKFEQLESGITRKYGGTGLGLAISQQLVEAHGGTITVESRYGEGSIFTFLLPIKANKEENK
ncbi:MAG: PAS domain S-box protein [Candidatus Methanoperedens sp.]|nr:PAS domain S-box protein [Candidatus Methanoperedens sp.]